MSINSKMEAHAASLKASEMKVAHSATTSQIGRTCYGWAILCVERFMA
jgi:hypothetical protein